MYQCRMTPKEIVKSKLRTTLVFILKQDFQTALKRYDTNRPNSDLLNSIYTLVNVWFRNSDTQLVG